MDGEREHEQGAVTEPARQQDGAVPASGDSLGHALLRVRGRGELHSRDPRAVLALQRAVGNAAVGRLLARAPAAGGGQTATATPGGAAADDQTPAQASGVDADLRARVMEPLGKADVIILRSRLMELTAEQRAELEGDATFMAALRTSLPPLARWIMLLVLRYGPDRPPDVRALYDAVSERDAGRLSTVLDGKPELSKVPGLREVVEHQFAGTPQLDWMKAAVGAAAATSQRNDEEAAYKRFNEYIATVQEPFDAIRRYQAWVADHRFSTDLLTITPPELWGMSLQGPRQNPRDAQFALFARFMQERQASDERETDPTEKRRRLQTMMRFQLWLERNQEARGFLKADPVKVYADLSVQVLKEDIDQQVAKQLEAEREARRNSPEAEQARKDKWDEFFRLAMNLWGDSSKRYPYTIPIPSEGRDILVTGDPDRQKLLNRLAGDLMSWATNHMYDDNYVKVNPKAVLVDLLKAGYGAALAEAAKKPLEHEYVDRHEIIPEQALAAFGETVGEGLLVIAVVGLFVGAEVITAGQATWLLVGVAGAGGISAFLDRREEIEKKGYNVSVPETMVYSAGDIFGVSQLIEGITGRRLGTEERLSSMARSGQLGTGAGSIATLLMGSKAFEAGEATGMRYRMPREAKLPAGPNANESTVRIPQDQMPPTPRPSAKPGPAEAAARASMPPGMQLGFDKWMEFIRHGGTDPETVLRKMPPRRVEQVSEQYARKHIGEVARAEEAQYLRERAADNPLRPILKNVKKVSDRVWIHYETTPPEAADVAHAITLAEKTGEPIHLFGDTASRISYPGIDGTIGNPPRPLSLKSHSMDANAGSARFAAQEALAAAKAHGYTQVEVSIRMPGKTVAEVKAAWNVKADVPGAHDPGPYYDGDVVASVIIRCADGDWRPPKAPSKTGPPPQRDRRGDKDQ